MFHHVLVRRPCPAVCEGITSAPELGRPDYEKALRQHDAYIEALRRCGVEVTVLDALPEFPDSCFVEDTAVLTPNCAIISNPGAPSRQKEPAYIVDAVKRFYPDSRIEYITAPGTMEGGDVMMVGDTFYIGRSARTNAEGIRQFTEILGRYGYQVVEVPLEKVLHLKTGVNYLEHGHMLVSGEFTGKAEFAAYQRHEIPEAEAYAANCIWVNEKVLVPEGYPTVEKLVREMGYEVILVDTSEFRKIDGGLSCLSLRFRAMR